MTMPKVKTFAYVAGKKYDGMMGRCYRDSDKSYKSYGGRGIKVCSAWIRDINTFRYWLKGEVERIGLTSEEFVSTSTRYQLDRIDPDGHYTPANCRLSSVQVGSRNTRAKRHKVITSCEGEKISFGG